MDRSEGRVVVRAESVVAGLCTEREVSEPIDGASVGVDGLVVGGVTRPVDAELLETVGAERVGGAETDGVERTCGAELLETTGAERVGGAERICGVGLLVTVGVERIWGVDDLEKDDDERPPPDDAGPLPPDL